MDYYLQESDRLKYRKLTKKDIPLWIPFFHNNDRLNYLGIDTSKSHEELAEMWIKKQLERYDNEGFGHLAVELKTTGEFIGMGGILPRELLDKPEYEVVYSLKPPYWGKGYATEIAQTMKKFGMENIPADRFISIIHIDNSPSVNVATKNGMSPLFKTEFMDMPVEVYGAKSGDQ